jgi:tetratricopeptide (TPR) repeat protein
LKAAQADLADCFARLDGCEAESELTALCKRCLSPRPADRPADAGHVASAVAGLRHAAEERARRAELDHVRAEGEKAAAELKAAEQHKRRRVQQALALAVGLLLLVGVAFGWWHAEQGRLAGERLARNAEAEAVLLDQCEQALRAGDTIRGAVALEAAGRRSSEGGGEELAARLEQCERDLAVLRELDAIDRFRWATVENKYADEVAVAVRCREALNRFGAGLDAASVEEVAARVSASAVRPRLTAALDRMLRTDRSPRIRAALRTIDPDPYRDAIRDAVHRQDLAAVAKLARQPAALEQPPEFAAFLGEIAAVGLERRRELLGAAVRRRPGDLGLLMALGAAYPEQDPTWSEERSRWYQAAVAVAPGNGSAHIGLGRCRLSRNDLDGGIAALREAVRLDPGYARAHCHLALALWVKKDLAGAVAECKEAIRLDPRDSWAHNTLGLALWARKDLEGAVAAFKEGIRLHAAYAAPRANLGGVLSMKKDLEGAVAAYRDAVRAEPWDAGSHYVLGLALLEKKDLAGAVVALKEAVRLRPEAAVWHYFLGNALRDAGRFDEAEQAYREAVRLDGNRPGDALDALARLLESRGNREGAIVLYRKKVVLAPGNASAHYNLGVALLDGNDLAGAVAALREAVRLDPGRAKAHAELGFALWKKNDLAGAVAACKEALRLDARIAWCHNTLGLALREQKDVKGAVAAFKEAVRLNPADAEPHANLGWALHLDRDLEGAVAAFKEAIRLEPKSASHQHNLGIVLSGGGRLDEAERAYREAVRLDGNRHGDAIDHLARLLYRRGNLDSAIAAYRQAIRLDPKPAYLHNELASVLVDRGNLDAAVAEYKEVLRLDPRNAHALTNLPWTQQKLKLLPRLPDVLAGKDRPRSPVESAEFAYLCALHFQQRYAAAARLFENAFAGEPRLAENLAASHRYNAACWAARAARGDGIGAPAGEAERLALRGKARAWLRDDLAAWRKQAASTEAVLRQTAATRLLQWLKDADLSAVRPGPRRGRMTAEERSAWDGLWADVMAALALASKPLPAAPKK